VVASFMVAYSSASWACGWSCNNPGYAAFFKLSSTTFDHSSNVATLPPSSKGCHDKMTTLPREDQGCHEDLAIFEGEDQGCHIARDRDELATLDDPETLAERLAIEEEGCTNDTERRQGEDEE